MYMGVYEIYAQGLPNRPSQGSEDYPFVCVVDLCVYVCVLSDVASSNPS